LRRLVLAIASGLAVLSAAPTPALAACTSKWYISYGGNTDYVLVKTDTSGIPLASLRFDMGYSSNWEIGLGFLDFNGDGATDVFHAKKRSDGSYQWRYSSPSGTGAWVNLGRSRISPADLRFGDFEGDSRTDVFVVLPANPNGVRPWAYADDGFLPLKPLAAIDKKGPSKLRFGDFDFDSKTDVFSVKKRPDGFLQWRYSPGGANPYVSLAFASTPLDKMRFGDFDANGKTDLFTTQPAAQPGFHNWVYSPNGTDSYTLIATTGIAVGQIRVGKWDVDFKSDLFAVAPESDGFKHWYWKSPTPGSSFNALAYDTRSVDQLRLGDFNGDNVTDVFAMTRTC
jgi:hypothetical protein